NPEKELTVDEHNGQIKVLFTDSVINRKIELHPDFLVLASAIIPPEDTGIARMFKVPLNDDGFYVEAHVKLRPVDFATAGVFVCGLAHGPKSIDESIAQAQAAAARAVTLLSLSTFKIGGVTGEINSAYCTGCGVCVSVCPYQAINLNEESKAEINEAVCKGCGLCAASCRSGAASLKGFGNAAIFAQISAF
ncbi:4Fe-4S binding protein, partial [bacterium]|nr:4Fe-4S binding protein [bacterium]